MRTLNENLAVRAAGTPGTWAATAYNGNWIQIAGKARRVMFCCINGELDGNMVVQVQEATSAAGAGAQNLSGLTGTFTNGTDEGRVGLIEVRQEDLSSGYTHVSLLVTPTATDSFAAVAILDELYEAPAGNATTDGVAFNVGE